MIDMEKLEAKIRVKLDGFQADGGKLIRGIFRSGDDCRCLVDACFPNTITEKEINMHRAEVLSSVLDIPIANNNMWVMILAWDEPIPWKNQNHFQKVNPYYQLGYRLQRDYKPVSASCVKK